MIGEEALTTAVPHAPHLVVLSVVVIAGAVLLWKITDIYLRHLNERDQMLKAIGQECHDHAKSLQEKYSEDAKQTRNCMDQMRITTGQLLEYLHRKNGKE